MSKLSQFIVRHNLSTTDGYDLIRVAEDYARLMGISVDCVIEAGLTSREYANHLISVMRKRQK